MKHKRSAILTLSFFLGSCTPVPQNTSVFIVTKTETVREDHGGIVCTDARVMRLPEYTLPPLPDLSHIRDDDEQAVVAALAAYVGKLRTEMESLTVDYGCRFYPPRH